MSNSDTATSAHDAWVKDALGVDPTQYAATDASGGADRGDPGGLVGALTGPVSVGGGSAIAAAGSGSDSPQPLDKPPAGPCNEQPTWTDNSPVPADVSADTVVDFVNQMNSALGGNPHCNIDVNYQPDGDTTITKANVTIQTTIVRPRLGLSRASQQERALIDKAVALVQAHEERHRGIVRQVYAPFPCAIVGKTDAQGQADFRRVRQEAYRGAGRARREGGAAAGGRHQWGGDRRGVGAEIGASEKSL